MGAGKSSVIDIFRQLQIPVIDCDNINEQLLQPMEEGYQKVIQTFGNDILFEDQTINKQKLSSMIFHDKPKKQLLESILHPLIKQRVIQTIQTLQSSLVVVEVPLLYEIHWETLFDEIWVVACDRDILLERLSSQRNISKEEAHLRLAHQMSQEDKILKADVVVYNDGNRQDLRKQILHVLEKG